MPCGPPLVTPVIDFMEIARMETRVGACPGDAPLIRRTCAQEKIHRLEAP